MQIRRRDFLGSALAGVGATVLSGKALAADAPKAFDPFEIVPLHKTGIKVSRVGLGTGMRGWMRQTNHTRMGAERFDALVKHCWDQGVRLFDVADLYGTHSHLARALKGKPRDQYAIISKVWVNPSGIPEPIEERPTADGSVERFLKELQTDYLDIVLLHCQTSPEWPTIHKKHTDGLAKLKAKGVIKAHGVSCHSLAALEAAAAEPWVDVVLSRINPYGAKMDGPPEKVAPVLKKAHDAGKAVIGMKIIGEGDFRNDDEKRDKSVAYALTCGFVDAFIVGCEAPAEVDDLAARVRKVPRPV
jgi:aryl-alcohol dehydrogenase-like predicted oxidoreductase